jgi:hypothetical protein
VDWTLQRPGVDQLQNSALIDQSPSPVRYAADASSGRQFEDNLFPADTNAKRLSGPSGVRHSITDLSASAPSETRSPPTHRQRTPRASDMQHATSVQYLGPALRQSDVTTPDGLSVSYQDLAPAHEPQLVRLYFQRKD